MYDNINKFMSSHKYVMYIHAVGIICTVLVVRRQKPTRNQQQTQRPHVDNKCLCVWARQYVQYVIKFIK